MNGTNEIHATCIIGDRVEIGSGNKLLPNSIIYGPTKIGDNNIIGPNVVIGSPGQDTRNPRYDSSDCYVEIGDNNIIREFSAIHKPCYREITKMGSNIFLMQGAQINHDVILHDNVVLSPMCALAGIVTVLKASTIGMGSAIHQYSVIGHYSFTGMGSIITKNIRPFTIHVTNRPARVNYYAIEKFGYTPFTDEIVKYVMEGVLPANDSILSIFEEFERLHINSKRLLYK